MSANKHTNEPWPPFTDIATTMTPDPEGTPVAILSCDDYIRARACVNACAGIPNEQLECDNVEFVRIFNERNTLKNQRDELLDIMDAAARTLDRDGDEWGLAADFRAAIASIKNGAPATCEKCNTPDLCREYGRACDPYEIPETSVPAIVFYPAGSLGEEVHS